jgi:hypothetical protein
LTPLRIVIFAVAALSGLISALLLFLLTLPFLLFSVMTRLGSWIFEPQAIPWNQVIEYEPEIGWKPKVNLDAHNAFVAGVFHVRTDNRGWRGRANLEESKVIVFGDSYAFGYGVDEDSLYSDRLPGLLMKGIGAPGYNMVQSLLWMKKLAPHLDNKLVVWFICVSNDLYDNLQFHMQEYKCPFVRAKNDLQDWEIVTTHVDSTHWLYNAERDHASMHKGRYVAAFGTTTLTKRAYAACEFLVRQGRDICNGAGGKLVVMTVPNLAQFNAAYWRKEVSRFGDPGLFDPNRPDKEFAEICKRLTVPFVAGSKHLQWQDHILEDGHWNADGHKRVAEILGELYTTHVLKSEKENPVVQTDSPAWRLSQSAG